MNIGETMHGLANDPKVRKVAYIVGAFALFILIANCAG